MTIKHSNYQIKTKKEANQIIGNTLDSLNRTFSKKEIDGLAWETGFVRRSSSRISGFEFLISMLVASADASHTTLEKICSIFRYVSHTIKMTAQGVMKRINSQNAVAFLEAVYSRTLAERFLDFPQLPAPLLEPFSKVLLQDSSSMTLQEELQAHFKGSGGRASKASAKLDVIFDYKKKRYESIKLTDQKEADQTLALRIEDVLTENSLVIRDLGYLGVPALLQIMVALAFFLSRLKSNIMVYLSQDDEQSVDLGAYLDKLCEQGVVDLNVFITAEKLPVRLIAYKAPQEVADKRRREAIATAKKQGRILRQETLKLFEFTIFITNVSPEVWTAEVIGTVYRIRWQIELIFKCWKSRVQIHYLKGTNPERIKCLVYARIIFVLLVNQIYTLAEYIAAQLLGRMASMPKVFEWVKDAGRLISIIKGSLAPWERRCFIDTVSKSMCMQTRNRKTTLEIVCETEIYYSKTS
jgi:hypothetical protein